MKNGLRDIDEDSYDKWASASQHLTEVSNIAAVIPVLDKSADAIIASGRALQSIAGSLTKIGADTARAISDTVELRRHLKAITDREQVMRRELDEVKALKVVRRELDEVKALLRPKPRRKAVKRKAKKR
jgi:enamine deaminase RidA (YjgF/YER057c/UK114 family)